MNHTLEMAYNLSDTLIISYSQHYTFRPHYSNYRAAMWFFYICNSLEFVTFNLFIYLFIYFLLFNFCSGFTQNWLAPAGSGSGLLRNAACRAVRILGHRLHET